MNTEQRLDRLADTYRAQGYVAVVRPAPADLPDFAKDFKVEIVARGEGGSVLASAKRSQLDLESDRELPRYAEVISRQPGWRFDLFVLGPESQPQQDKIAVTELTEDDIGRVLTEVERMLEAGFARPAFIGAWSVLETAMRRRLQAEGEEAGWGSSPRTMLNELYSAGVLQTGLLRRLEGLYQTRNAVVHGFTSPVIEKSDVEFLAETTRRLLRESEAARKTA